MTGTQAVGTFGGVAYTRTWGVARGRVAADEKVEGLAALPKDAAGAYAYSAEFEVIALAAGCLLLQRGLRKEAENRGSPLMIDLLNYVSANGKPSAAVYPPGMGEGFLFNHRISYARIHAGRPASPRVFPTRRKGWAR